MGFRSNAYATIWEIKSASPSVVRARISTSKKNRDTGSYETDFSGFVSFVGTSAATKAASLQPKDRIKIIDCDVSNKYDKEKDVTYTNYTIFSFEIVENNGQSNSSNSSLVDNSVDSGEMEPSDLPF